MSLRRTCRRRVTAPSGRSYIVCGRNVARVPLREPSREGGRNGSFVWVSGATLLLMLLFSAYVVERPPVFASDLRPSQPGIAGAGYSLSDALHAISR